MPPRRRRAAADAARQKAAFIERFDAACKHLRREARRLSSGPLPDRATYIRELAKAQDDAVATLRAIRPPARDREAIRRNLAIRAQTAKLLRKLADAMERSDLRALRTLGARIGRNVKQTNRFAHRYGFKVCGSSGPR